MGEYQISGPEIDFNDHIFDGLSVKIINYSPFIQIWMFSSDESYISQYRNTRSNIVNREKANTIRKKILAQTLNTTESEIIVELGDNGKPLLRNPPSTLEFSTSYTHSCWVLAISHKGSIGIDIEKIAPASIEHIFKVAFSDREQAMLKRCPPGATFESWTAKEAYLKYIKKGFNENLRQVEVIDGRIYHRRIEQDLSLFSGRINNEYALSLVYPVYPKTDGSILL